MGERNSSYLKQYNNESLSVEDIGVIENLSVNVSAKPNISALDQSTEIINSTSSQEEETHSSDAKQLTTSLVRREARKTGFVQATPQKMVTYTGMKENLASIKREKRESLSHKVSLSQGLDIYGLGLSTSSEQEQMNNQSPASRDTSAYCNGGLPARPVKEVKSLDGKLARTCGGGILNSDALSNNFN
ncbi:hypothetical protein NC651_004706 [Populus alba x Populus x berolinensis]|nr:hypothetical protein NC651_004706 [Populus alba x Populus x berolinensis]